MPTFTVTSTQVLAPWTFNAYSLTQTPWGDFVGGWATEADVGPDLIYRVQDGALTPVQWTAPPGAYHLNDLSLVAPTGADRAGWVYTYGTDLWDGWTTFEDITTHNELFFASSTDSAHTLTFHGPIATDTWSPSAVQMGDHIEIFSHDKYGRAQELNLDENGWQVTKPNELLVNTTTGSSFTALNLQVSQEGDHYRMVANSGTLHDVLSFTSTDRLHWTPWNGTDGVLLHSDDHLLLTPEWHNGTLTFSQDGNWEMLWTGYFT